MNQFRAVGALVELCKGIVTLTRTQFVVAMSEGTSQSRRLDDSAANEIAALRSSQ
jgi:hypothetical protein